MKVIQRDGLTCVELNVPSSFSTYKPLVDPMIIQDELLVYDLVPNYLDLTIAKESYNKRNENDYVEYYKLGDQLMN